MGTIVTRPVRLTVTPGVGSLVSVLAANRIGTETCARKNVRKTVGMVAMLRQETVRTAVTGTDGARDVTIAALNTV